MSGASTEASQNEKSVELNQASGLSDKDKDRLLFAGIASEFRKIEENGCEMMNIEAFIDRKLLLFSYCEKKKQTNNQTFLKISQRVLVGNWSWKF